MNFSDFTKPLSIAADFGLKSAANSYVSDPTGLLPTSQLPGGVQFLDVLSTAGRLGLSLGNDSGSSSSSPIGSYSVPTKDELFHFLEKALNKKQTDPVSEEEVYTAILEERLNLEGKDVAQAYQEAKDSFVSTHKENDSSLSMEEVAVRALQEIIRQGKISSEKVAEINGQAFAAAQLDDNPNSLYGGLSPTGHTTSPALPLEEALFDVLHNISRIFQGQTDVKPISVDTSNTNGTTTTTPPVTDGSTSTESNPTDSKSQSSSTDSRDNKHSTISTDGSHQTHSRQNKKTSGDSSKESDVAGRSNKEAGPKITPSGSDAGGKVAGPGSPHGFSWDPDSSGHVSVTMPKEVSGNLKSVEIHSDLPASADTKLDEGRYVGKTATGQETYSFSKRGSDYGKDIVVVGFKKGGTQVSYEISNGAKATAA